MVRYIDPTEQLVVELSVRDLTRSVAFYRALGFDLLREEERFAMLAWEGHQLFLQQGDHLPEPSATAVINVRVMVPDVDQIWQRATERGPRIIVPIGDRHYGLRDFTIADPDGFELRFATRSEPNAAPGDQATADGDEKPKGRAVKLDAKPEAITLDTAKTAVIVVDMQNDFGSKGGMFDRAGIDISGIQKAVAPTAKVLAAARKAGIKVIYIKMGFRPDLSDMGAPDSVNRVRHVGFKVGEQVTSPDGKESRIMIRDTWNTDIVSELKPEAGDDVLYKTRFSCFYETDLDARLKKMGAKYLIVTGCTTSVCVDSTVRDAMFRDYLCVLLADCMSEPIGQGLPRSNHEASLLTVEVLLGWVSDSERFLKALQP